jgi:hypothetical protein
MTETPKTIPKDFHGPIVGKNPHRFAIHGITDTIAGLKATVAGIDDLHPGLKSFIQDELDKVDESGAELHLHDVETINNGKEHGFNLHLSITHKAIGAKAHQIFSRDS